MAIKAMGLILPVYSSLSLSSHPDNYTHTDDDNG